MFLNLWLVLKSVFIKNQFINMGSYNAPIKSILIDLSGTLHIENAAIPGAVDALNRLRETNIPIKFVTNTTKESRRFLYERLCKLGFQLNEDEIFSSLWAARDLIISRKLSPILMLEEEALEDFQEVQSQQEADAVVIGLAPNKFNYDSLNTAFRLLLKGVPLIAIHEGRYYKRCDGLALGPGPFVKGLEYAASCKSEVVGKPSANFFKAALGTVDPKHAIMIGDDVRDDIGGAQQLGIRGYLVQTGKYRPGDEHKISPAPCQLFPSFTHAVDTLLQEMEADSH